MLAEAARTLWQRFDAVVAPTVPVVPPRVADLIDDDDAFGRTNALILRNPSVFNFLDTLRAVAALPSARRRTGRPDAGGRAARRRRVAGDRPWRRGGAQQRFAEWTCGALQTCPQEPCDNVMAVRVRARIAQAQPVRRRACSR